jgi:hypothetical protein
VLDFNLAADVLNSLHEALSRFVRGGYSLHAALVGRFGACQ